MKMSAENGAPICGYCESRRVPHCHRRSARLTRAREARGQLVGVMIDGARIASPGLVKFAIMANRLADRAVILTLGFHLGSEVQMKSVRERYNQEQEDRLLTQDGWTDDGYRLFDISVFAGSSAGGWFKPISESNAIFMRKAFGTNSAVSMSSSSRPAAGYVNLDTLTRAVALPGVTVVTLLGEGTFHQVHGGVATNATHNVQDAFHAEYMKIRGRLFKRQLYQSLYVGSVPLNALRVDRRFGADEIAARTGKTA